MREAILMAWMIIMIKTSMVKAPNPIKQLMRVIHLKMRSGMPSNIVENKIFIWILTSLFWLKRWLLEIQLVMFHWSGTRMKNILDMTLLGKRLERKKDKINWIPFSQVLMTQKIG